SPYFLASYCAPGDHPHVHSFPTRRSSDLIVLVQMHQSLGIKADRTGLRDSNVVFREDGAHLRHCVIRDDNISRLHIEERQQVMRSEEHTSELQSRSDLVCRLLLEKKKHMH